MGQGRTLCPGNTQDITSHTHRSGVSLLGGQALGQSSKPGYGDSCRRKGQQQPHCVSLSHRGGQDKRGHFGILLLSWASTPGPLLQGWLDRCEGPVLRGLGRLREGQELFLASLHSIKSTFFPPAASTSAWFLPHLTCCLDHPLIFKVGP